MDTLINHFWSFRSPYPYLAVPGAMRLEQDFKVKVRFRPVLPLAVRDPGFFSPDSLKRAKHIRLDEPRRAEVLGMHYAWPKPDPIVQDMQTYKIAAEQPHIRRLTYLGVEAERRGSGPPFAREVSALIFGARAVGTKATYWPTLGTGACRRLCWRVSRSSARTGLIGCGGGLGSGSCHEDNDRAVARCH